MNLPNKITLTRIFLIPIFIVLMSIPFEWGTITLTQNEIPVTHFIAALIFIIASGTDWLDGYIARKYGLITNLGKFLDPRSEEHTSELQSRGHLVCRLLLEKKKQMQEHEDSYLQY